MLSTPGAIGLINLNERGRQRRQPELLLLDRRPDGFSDARIALLEYAAAIFRQEGVEISLRSPADDVDFNSMASGAATPSSVHPATGQRKLVGAVAVLAKQFH